MVNDSENSDTAVHTCSWSEAEESDSDIFYTCSESDISTGDNVDACQVQSLEMMRELCILLVGLY